MKPILVKNNEEWLRLDPVLEKIGYVWGLSKKKPTNFNPITNMGVNDNGEFYLNVFCINFDGKSIRWFANPNYKCQTVDEFLLSLEDPMKDFDSWEGKALRVAIDRVKQANKATDNELPKVDDFLSTQATDNLFENAIATDIPKEPQNWQAMYWEMVQARTSAVKEVQEVKAENEKLKQGIKDAIAEMGEEFTKALELDRVLRADAYTDCIEILTSKTKTNE